MSDLEIQLIVNAVVLLLSAIVTWRITNGFYKKEINLYKNRQSEEYNKLIVNGVISIQLKVQDYVNGIGNLQGKEVASLLNTLRVKHGTGLMNVEQENSIMKFVIKVDSIILLKNSVINWDKDADAEFEKIEAEVKDGLIINLANDVKKLFPLEIETP